MATYSFVMGTLLYPSNNCRGHENHTLLVFVFRATVSVFKSRVLNTDPVIAYLEVLYYAALESALLITSVKIMFFCPCVCRQDNLKSC